MSKPGTRTVSSLASVWICVMIILSFSSQYTNADQLVNLEGQQHTTGAQLGGEQQTRLTPKVALLFLVTTHVKHEELWGQWLHLAAGLHVGDHCPMPSPDIDLDKRYGPEHSPVTDKEKAQVETGRQEITTQMLNWVTNGRQLSNTDWNSPASGSEAVDSATLEEIEEQTWLKGEFPEDVGQIYAAQSLFTIYVHNSRSHKRMPVSIFTGREIPDLIDTTDGYGQHVLMKAERELLKEALKDPNNVKFVLVGHDAIPIYPPWMFWAQLMSEGVVSRVGNLWVAMKDKGWLPAMETGHYKPEHYRTSSQWFVLIRAHAMLITRDTHVDQIFERLCGRENENCVSDEVYVPTLLATYNASSEMDGCGCSTHVVFSPPNWSPHTYTASEINSSLIHSMRRNFDDNCPWEEMLELSTRVFNYWANGGGMNHTLLGEIDWTNLDDLGKYVQASGYLPYSKKSITHCPLLARKFPGERKGILLKTMLDCDGGGLASHCPRPHKREPVQ